MFAFQLGDPDEEIQETFPWKINLNVSSFFFTFLLYISILQQKNINLIPCGRVVTKWKLPIVDTAARSYLLTWLWLTFFCEIFEWMVKLRIAAEFFIIHCSFFCLTCWKLKFVTSNISPLSANPTKWSNRLKQFFDKLPTNCLGVFDYFVKLALKGLVSTCNLKSVMILSVRKSICESLLMLIKYITKLI